MGSEIILFEHPNFQGAHRHLFASDPNLSHDGSLNDQTSSIAVLGREVSWRLFRHPDFSEPYPVALTEGLYPDVTAFGIQNDDISSVQATGFPPTTAGAPIEGHAILYEHPGLRGAHKHVFRAEPNLNLPLDNFFNDRVSSIAVLQGNWVFCRHASFQTPYPLVLGSGLYPFVTSVGIEDDSLSSLLPTGALDDAEGEAVYGNTVLFEHPNFRGAHRHFFQAEPDLSHPLDSSLNDRASSVAVLEDRWYFYSDPNFGRFQNGLAPGLYPWVVDRGIPNDDLSSLQPFKFVIPLHDARILLQIAGGPPFEMTELSHAFVAVQRNRTSLRFEEEAVARPPFPTEEGGDFWGVNFKYRGAGTLDRATGAIRGMRNRLLIGGSGLSSEAVVRLGTGLSISPQGTFEVRGAPFDFRTGELRLAGTSQLRGDLLNGADCALTITGFFSAVI